MSVIIEFEPHEAELAGYWHGGQSSMLYAVASIGALAHGTARPYGLTDAQWSTHLAEQLESEVNDAITLARRQVRTSRGVDKKTARRELGVLYGIMEKVSAFLRSANEHR